MATLIIKTNVSQVTDVLISDLGVLIPGSGGSVTFTNQDALQEISESRNLLVLTQDDAFGAGSSTLILNDGTTDVAQADVESFLQTVPFPDSGPYALVIRDAAGELPLNDKITVQENGSNIVTNPDTLNFGANLFTITDAGGNDVSIVLSGTLVELNTVITDATLDDAGDPRDPNPHASTHITGGLDEIDGDQLDIDYTPTYYTPTTAPAEATNVDHLTAHLAGLDNLNFSAYAETEAEAGTTSATFATRVSITQNFPSGNYLIWWSAELRGDSGADRMSQARLYNTTDAVEYGASGTPTFVVGVSILLSLSVRYNSEYQSAGGIKQVALSGTKTIAVQWRRETGQSGTAFIRRARLFIRRVS